MRLLMVACGAVTCAGKPYAALLLCIEGRRLSKAFTSCRPPVSGSSSAVLWHASLCRPAWDHSLTNSGRGGEVQVAHRYGVRRGPAMMPTSARVVYAP
eukprot:scaffold13583_cov27-Tisochrysis_lutea.AAC.5